MTRRFRAGLAMMLAIVAQAELRAAPPAPAPASQIRFVLPLLNGSLDPARIVTADMLAQVPATRIVAGFAELRALYGRAQAVEKVEAATPLSAAVTVRMERATLKLSLAAEAKPPHRITGLQVIGVDVPHDSAAAVISDLRKLPGRVGLSVAALGEAEPRVLAVSDADRPVAIGSAFKLFLLAELMREIRAGERHWGDVVPLDRHSLPSGILQDWPAGSPLTLHSLAALMISRSDNSAADTLLHLLGREKVEALLPALGVQAAARNKPFLSTRELFAIKADPPLTARWTAAGEEERRGMLPALEAAPIDTAALAGAPRAIDRVEWFASPADLVRTMDWLRRNLDEAGLAILAINNGLGPGGAVGLAYLGYKGGSETGVIEMTFLIRRRDGGWRAAALAWNNPAAAVDEPRFVALATRLVALQR